MVRVNEEQNASMTWLKVREAARHIKMSEAFLNTDRCTGKYGIPYKRIGRTIRYSKSELDDWMEKQASKR